MSKPKELTRSRTRVWILVAAGCFTSACAHSQSATPSASQKPAVGDLAQLSIEDLMNIEVTSGAKKEESVQQTAAAIFVITSEDIRRSGATNIPDVLRMVPGLEVAQNSANSWGISSRGFNDVLANKMLVLVDGRTVYSPVFSGVFWDSQDMLLANVERIEVIRGPGAALWGTNAVNGVINIITKSAEKTQGALLTAAGGNVEGGYGAAQFGSQIQGKLFYRAYIKGFAKDSVPGAAGMGPQGGWDLEHAGFRADWNMNSRDTLTVEGDLFQSSGQGTTNFTTSLAPLVFGPLPGFLETHGGNILSRWRRVYSPRSEISLQIYYDHENADARFVSGTSDTFDVQFEQRRELGQRHDLVWGLNYRAIDITTLGAIPVSFTPPSTFENLASGFLQDEIQLIPAKLRLTLGGRIEREYTSRVDFQPDARLLWTPTLRQSVWFAASRALRGVSISDTSAKAFLGPISTGSGPLIIPEALGNPSFRPEAEVALQAGYRSQISSRISIDATGFWNRYTRLRGVDAGAPIFVPGPGTPFILAPEISDNKISGQTHGIEFFAAWKPVSIWKLSGGYTWLDGALRDDSIGAPPNTTNTNLQSPHHQFSIRSSLDLPHRVEVDGALYRVGPLDTLGVQGYYRIDLRLGWRVGEHAEFSVAGQNLLSPAHMEAPIEPDWIAASAIRRSFYVKMTWTFQEHSKK